MQRVGVRYGTVALDGPWDAVVIGSGLGGLATAALLAKHAGKRVLVLERHYMPGGFTHAYRRHGYEWDVGLHYIGEVHRRETMTSKLYEHVMEGRLEWQAMDDVYDRVVMEDRVYDFPAGVDAFRERLKGYFPDEATAIDRYLETVHAAARTMGAYFAEKAVPGLVSKLAGGRMRRGALAWSRRTTREVLEELTDDRELIGVLTAQWGDYGLPPGRSSFLMHAAVARHYLEGAAYPVGGASALAGAVAPLIESTGGAIAYQADVESIVTDGNRAVGVRLGDGTEVHAPLVISNAGVLNTFERLLPVADRDRHGLGRRTESVRPSTAHLCLYAGFRKTALELGFETTNLWLYPGPDHDRNVAEFLAGTDRPLPVVYASFPSAKDPSFESRYPDRATLELITLASFEQFEPWDSTDWRERGESYEALKESYAQRMLERFERQVPGVASQIDYYEVSTPLSTSHFANYRRGEIYGVDHSPDRFEQRWLRPRTPVKGLFLTGQDVVTAGVTPALLSGYLTASAILGRNLLSAVRG